MEHSNAAKLRIGAWCVHPASGEISRGGETVRLEARTMRLLVCLAERAGEVVSIDSLLDQVWSGVFVSQDSVYQAVASLRRTLGDDPKQPAYIETMPRLGYRMVAAVSPWGEPAGVTTAPDKGSEAAPGTLSTPAPRLRGGFVLAAVLILGLGLALAFALRGKPAIDSHAASPSPLPQKSVAVLPFLDLTDSMSHEIFADGMTEELIDKLSKVPGFRVPGATSSFYFKGKKMPVAEIARSLGVAYILDGSVRKSGTWLRVDTRLVRADNGYVIWTETYDQPFDNLLMIQDDIAGKVTKALRASIEGTPKQG